MILRPKPWQNYKTWKNAFFAGFWEGPNAIQRYPSLSQTRENCKSWKNAFFCWFPGRPQRYPTLSVLIPDPRKIAKPGKISLAGLREVAKLGKIAKPGKMHFLLLCGRAPTLSNAIRPYPRPYRKMQNLEKCIFCWLAGGTKRWNKIKNIYRKMLFLLLCGRAPTLSNVIRPYPKPRKN